MSNRIIKFRLIRDDKVVGYMELQPKCCETSNRLLWRYSENGETNWSGCGKDVIDFDTAEAFTGLLDRHGTEIYEGDVVVNQVAAERTVKRTKYGEYRLFCGNHHSHFYKGWVKGIEWEVIGNIHKETK